MEWKFFKVTSGYLHTTQVAYYYTTDIQSEEEMQSCLSKTVHRPSPQTGLSSYKELTKEDYEAATGKTINY